MERYGPNDGYLKDTQIIIKNPSSYEDDSSVPILYVDKIRIHNRNQEVQIKANLEINKKLSPVDRGYVYIVHVNFTAVQTKPEELKEYLEFKQERRKDFYAKDGWSQPKSENGERVNEYLQKIFEKLLSRKKEDRNFTLPGRKGDGPRDSSKTEDSFKIQRLWEALSHKPKAHCVARAVQLLSINGQYSSVCNLKFPYVKDKSLPTPGQSILKEDGLYALSKLFVDGIVGASPIITSAEKFQLFGQKMKQFFERYDQLENVNTMPKSLNDIVDKPPGFCAAGMERISVSGEKANALREKVRDLMNRQATHVKNVMGLLFQLFNEEKVRAGVFEMNPMVIHGGTELVNKIAEVARELLIGYYGDCEKSYNEGLKIVNPSAAR